MGQKKYKIRFAEIAKRDMEQIVTYITYNLASPRIAENILLEINEAIKKRAENPEIYARYYSIKDRENVYYKIYVKNKVIFYIILDEDIIEIRRILNKRQNIIVNDVLN